MEFLKKMSLVPMGLRYKLMVVFCLMAVIPLLVAAYFVRDKLFSPNGTIMEISLILLFVLIITILGLLLAKQMIEPIIELAFESKLLADGDLNRRISVASEDEIGDLGRAINKLTSHIKNNMDELTSYGEKTKLINTEIHKKVLALSSLLQIGEYISAAVMMEDVMNLIVEKIAQLMDGGYAALYLLRTEGSGVFELSYENNLANESLHGLMIQPGAGFLGCALVRGEAVYADSTTEQSKEVEAFREGFGVKNFAAFPITCRNKPTGVLLAGNNGERFVFKGDDVELLKIFSKQVAIAYDREVLAKKARELSIQDDLTSLYNEKYITLRLTEEIKRGLLYQRPCSYIIFNVDAFDDFRRANGELATESALKKIAGVLEDHTAQIGRAARLAGDKFALLLPEKNKREAYRVAEDVRKKVECLDLEVGKKAGLTISGGVSENPIDGSSAEEIKEKAEDSLAEAKRLGKNKIL